ncbi:MULTISPECIES: SMI1/KNR4 family protein [unclassified Micromonospora]|uniref:SMI1/KNR4 family protein n=1 Tax=unclassified Micromonospora TaxID=2617518 RepID=UPI001C24F0E8|nr:MULTISPECIES: SMI1/KNR4 family protein [unclassified Micromonospora]MBU8859413.1 SMI1/KNR4 family protein [Micromonospora sp. WMMB482]MDM4778926.1 SMI1/KNR4 family protein [Micromonospora sp. b486]
MNRYVEQLVQSVPPPARRVPQDWPAVERSLGFELPGDYKDLVDQYGPGKFDDFLAVLTPGHPVPRLDLSYGIAEAADVLREYLSSGESLPASVEQLLAVALTDNGDTVYWVRGPDGSPEQWRTAVNGARDFGEWHLFDGGLAHFLLAVLNRELVVPAFADDFPYPDAAPTFTPYDPGTVR